MIAAWWHALVAKERRIVGIGAVLAVLLLGWALVWHPLAIKRIQLQQDVDNQRRDLAYVRLGAAEIQSQHAAGSRSLAGRQGKSLLALADASARSSGLEKALKRVEPIGERSVRVTFDDASFDAMMRWIEALSRTYGIEASDLSANRADGIGRVNARVTLQDAP